MSESMQSENECELEGHRTIERLYICLYFISLVIMEACGMRVKSTFRLIDIVSELWFNHFKSVIATDFTF